MKKNKLLLGILLNVGFMTWMQPAWAENNIEGSEHITEDQNITIDQIDKKGINVTDLTHEVTAESGKKIVITSESGQSSDQYIGISAENGGSVDLSGNQVTITEGNGKLGVGIRSVGENSSVKIGNNSRIESSEGTAISAFDKGKVSVGDNAVIKAGVWGSGSGAVSASWGGELTIGKNAFIINDGTNHAHKDDHNAVEASRDAKLEIGEGSQIYTSGEGTNHGIITELGAEVIIGKNSIISTAGNESLGIAPGGDNSYGLYATDDSSIKIGEGSLIKTGGEGSYAVVATTGKQITLEDKVQIESTAVGIYSMSDGTLVTGGNDMRITETSEEGIAVYATEEGEVILGDRAVIKAENTSGHGVYASGAGSKITVGKDAYIQVGAGESRGVYASKGGEISLAGATIRAAGSEDSFAILASGVDSSAISKIHGDGKFVIEGDISAGDYSEIHLDMTEESYFKGMTEKTDESNLEISLDKSRWDLTKSSELDRLMVSDGVVDLSQAGLGTTLEVDHLEAGVSGGTFVFQTDIAGAGNGINNLGDKLIVRESSQGDHQVHVINNGAADTNGSETLTIIETADGMTSGVDFQLTNEVEAGGYTYGMRAIDGSASDKNWELYSTGEISHPADAAVNLFSGSYLLNYAEMNTLIQRMGDLRNGEDKGNIWARTFGGKMKTKGGSLLRGYDMDYWGLQVGADKKFDLKKGDLYVGGMFGYSKGDIGYRSGSGSIDSKSIGVYGTYIASNDFYADLVLKYGWMKDDFKVYDTAGNLVKGDDIDTNGLTASLEIGKRYHFDKIKEGWYIEPQGQISISHYNGDSFTASNGLNIRVDSYDSILGRLGTNIGYEIKGGKNPINVYGKVSYVHEFDGDVDYHLNRSKESTTYGDSWWTYGIGITAKVGEKHNVYLDIERASGGHFTQSWNVNGGYRYSW